MQNILIVIISLLIIEFFIQSLIKRVKKEFHWFIEKKDIFPIFEKKKFNNFLKNSFDKKLGWKRKSNFTGYDRIGEKKIKFKINKNGYRDTKYNKKPLIVSFGGSYVFCRQVADEYSWQEQLSKRNKFNVLNYGVGNYGTDQALLYYKSKKFKKSTKLAILGIVPEHISRIQSEWKHFSEFGNIHGFKPKFYLKKKKLFLKKNKLNKSTKIRDLHKIIKSLQNTDRFYKDRFLKSLFSFPYLFNFIRNFSFNISAINIFFKYKKNLSIKKDLYLKTVMQRNINESHKLYLEKYSQSLFLEIFKKFKKLADRNNHESMVVIFPMMLDLKQNSKNNYINYFKNIVSKEIKVLDLTKEFINKKHKKIYVNNTYGSHFNNYGNKIVSNKIEKFIKKEFNDIF